MRGLRSYVEGVDYYVDPETGRLVWTESFLLERGFCCHARCRHCPWGYGRGGRDGGEAGSGG